jgi:hypothetical protein
MKSLLDIFNRIPEFSWNKLKQETTKSFERGYKLGKSEALDCLTDKQKYYCKNLNEWEKAIVMSFLEHNKLEFGYDCKNGGFYILKRIKPE